VGAVSPPRFTTINRLLSWTSVQNLSPFWRYSLACLVLALAVLLKLALNAIAVSPQGSDTPFLTMFAAIMITAWYAGFGPGVFVTLLGALVANYIFLEPQKGFGLPNTQDTINLTVFFLEGLLISGLCETLRQTLARRASEIEERRKVQQELAGERERYAVTLTSIGDAVIATDVQGRVSFMNAVAQNLTGWSLSEATGLDLSHVFKIINEYSHQPVENPFNKVLESGTVVGLANHTLLVNRAGSYIPIDDSGAPIKNEAGVTIGVVLIFRDVSERKRQEEQQTFLVEASEILASSLDYKLTLQNIVQLVVPFLADWCSIDLVNENGAVERVASAHIKPEKQAIVHDLHHRFPYPPNRPHPLKDLLLSGHSQISTQITQADLEMLARSPEHLQTLKELGLSSGMTVPLIIRGVGFGAFTLAITESDRRYTEQDLAVAQELARRASLALDNARLYSETQQALAQRTEAVKFHRELEEQLTVLVEASDSFLSSLQLNTLLPDILQLSGRLVAADAYGVWQVSPTTGEWHTLATRGLSEDYLQYTKGSLNSNSTITSLVAAENIEDSSALAGRLESYQKEGIRSLLVVPLRVRGSVTGTIAFYYHTPHRFSAVEKRVATALANLAAVAIANAELYEEQSILRLQAETAQQRVAFLAESSKVLASSLDYTTTLQRVAEQVVPKLADWCTVYVRDRDGKPKQLALTHRDPLKIEWALKLQQELGERFPYNPDAPAGLPKVIRTGQPDFYPVITDEMIVSAAPDKEILELIRDIGYSSSMLVPMKVRSEVIGAVQFIATHSSRQYTEQDLELAQELAGRAAMAVDNARLYAEAQQAITIRENFLSMAAHELKTPVTSLRGFTQLLIRRLDLQKELEPDRLRQALETINQQSERLLRLIVRLLDLSKLEAGRLILEPEITDLAALLNGLVEGLRATTDRHTLAIHTSGQPVPALIDALRIEQVVTNLVDNAIKYSPEGGLIELTLTPLPAQKMVELRVKDQGLGIPLEHREHIFEQFYQAQHRGFAGIGMGLYITRQIIELHGGRVEAEFPDEGGTCFVVLLPDGSHIEPNV
jgi:PAS domain S-box-containing protein